MTAAIVDPTLGVLEPGVYDIREDEYHADPVGEHSLSHSGAKRLLPPSCPAIFRYEREHGRPEKPQFDFGHAAHKLVLGVGPDLFGVDAEDWRTKDAKQQRDEIRAKGGVPLLAKDLAVVEEMALAIGQDRLASRLLKTGTGTPEASLFNRDVETGVMLRGRLDWLPEPADGRMILFDYKTAVCAHPDAFAKAAANYGYHSQAAWYLDLVTGLGLAEDAAFVFIVQEKTAPYLVSVVELDYYALHVGRERNRHAIDLYAECAASDTWPGYSDDVAIVSLPAWADRGLT